MNRRRTAALVLFASLLCWSVTVNAYGRDSDGSRMQARPHSLGTSASDRLSPPNDAVDWRYLRLKTTKNVSISVSVNPSSASVDVALTDAMGKSVLRGRTKDGSFRSSRRLDPGLYYISVSGSRAVSYTLSVD